MWRVWGLGVLLLPVRLLLWVLLLLVLPQVWLLGLLHGLTQRLLTHAAGTPPRPVVLPISLSEACARAAMAAHEQALREGKERWH